MNKTIRAAAAASFVTAALLLSSTSANAAAPATPQGVITAKAFYNLNGNTTLDGLTNDVKFPNSPDEIQYPNYFEWLALPDGSGASTTDFKNNYGVQMIGYFYPAVTGPTTFWIATDDFGSLFLSTDSNPANKVLIANVPGWNSNRQYDKYPEQMSVPITLTAGQPYYIEAQMKEAGGGDDLSVSIDGVAPIPGTMLSTFDKTSGPVNITTQPQSQTVQEGTPVSFSVVANGTPPYTYQWKKGPTDITDATNQTYSIQFTSAGDAGVYTVTVGGAQGSPVTSNPATLTVLTDSTKPTLVSASGSSDFTHVTVTYSERIEEASATNRANYAIGGGVTVTSGRLLSDSVVVLTTSTQTGGTVYTLTVNNVKDRAFVPNTILANSQITFNSAVFKTGIANWERWQDANGSADTTPIDTFVANLADPAFRGPDVTGVSSYLGSPRGVADNYGDRATCYFVPPTSGSYVFFFACDDLGYLYLSTDSNPANKKLIAAQPAWADQNQWIDPDTTETRSDMYSASEWTPPNVITLTAGTKYYMELDFQEGGGGDGSEATYKLLADADPVNGTASKLTGSVIGSYVDPAFLAPVITNRPVGMVYSKGDTLTFTVGVDSVKPVTYQWYQNKIAIPGPAGTSNPLVVANADYKAVGDYYVDVTSANGTATSFPDDNVRALMRGAFDIEVEDFNFASGQTKPEASVMPYLGNAYTNVTSQVVDVDYFNTADESGGAAVSYSRFQAADPAVIDMKGPNDPADYNRGDFTVTANYAIGWTDAGEWQNYTRTFPNGNYVIYGAFAYDGRTAAQIDQYLSLVANPTIADGSQPGVEGGLQGLTRLGTFKGPATGAWSSNDLFPLRDGSGNIVQVPLSGTKTLRLTANKPDGDQDFLLLYNVGTGTTPTISISGTTITFTGNLQRATTVNGTYSDVSPAPTSPYTVSAGAGAQQYFRARQ